MYIYTFDCFFFVCVFLSKLITHAFQGAIEEMFTFDLILECFSFQTRQNAFSGARMRFSNNFKEL